MTQERAVPQDLMQVIRRIAAEEVAKSYRSAPLRNASISEGGSLTIQGGVLELLSNSGGRLLYSGPVNPPLLDGTPQQGFELRRADGSLVFLLNDAFPGVDGELNQALTWRDRSNNTVIADDTDSAFGIARPYIPGVFYEARNNDWPTVTSTTFETVYRAKMPRQQPKLIVRAWGFNNTAGATGEIRVMVNGDPAGSTFTTSNSAVTEYVFGPVQNAGLPLMSTLTVEIQARMVSGSGAVQVGACQIQGQQS